MIYKTDIREFQFYDSPIKSEVLVSKGGGGFFCFNSMIVRLKGTGVVKNVQPNKVSIL